MTRNKRGRINMITEHNFQKIYLLQIDTPSGPRWLGGRIDIGLLPTTEERLAVCFPLTEDANSFGKRWYQKSFTVHEIELPFRLEYLTDDRIDHWQMMRYFRTRAYALAGFNRYMADARQSTLSDRTWRFIDLASGEVIQEAIPDNYELVSW
jgi:hypothetical protein